MPYLYYYKHILYYFCEKDRLKTGLMSTSETLTEIYARSFRDNWTLPALTDYSTDKTDTYAQMAKGIARMHIIPQLLNYQNTANFFASIVGSTTEDIDLKWVVIIAMGMNATNLILLRNSFEGVPSEIEEAARIDGATEMQILWQVYIPMSKATIATIALFFGISRWNGYFWAQKVMPNQKYSWPVQVFIRDFIENETALVGPLKETATFNSQTTSELSVVYAMVVCGVIPILVIYPFIQKYFAKGVNMGGVKE